MPIYHDQFDTRQLKEICLNAIKVIKPTLQKIGKILKCELLETLNRKIHQQGLGQSGNTMEKSYRKFCKHSYGKRLRKVLGNVHMEHDFILLT
jgi:hypothetical protein